MAHLAKEDRRLGDEGTIVGMQENEESTRFIPRRQSKRRVDHSIADAFSDLFGSDEFLGTRGRWEQIQTGGAWD